MTPAALIRAQQLRTPFRRLGQRRARWLAWRSEFGPDRTAALRRTIRAYIGARERWHWPGAWRAKMERP